MFNQATLFIVLLFAVGLLAKNSSLMVAAAVLFFIKLVKLEGTIFPILQTKGINWGVTIIMIAVLVPIATGEIGFKQLYETLKSPNAWIALISGAAVALIAKNGLVLLADRPQTTIALVFGTILAVALFKGVPVGPLIGAGIAFTIIQVVEWFH